MVIMHKKMLDVESPLQPCKDKQVWMLDSEKDLKLG